MLGITSCRAADMMFVAGGRYGAFMGSVVLFFLLTLEWVNAGDKGEGKWQLA
jgi:hypothetical protein